MSEQFVFIKFKISGYENKYILTQPKEKIEIKINTKRKQISQIKKFSDCIPVMVFDELRLTQRNALIQADFPFVVPNYQIYIPNVMLNLLEKDVIKKEYISLIIAQRFYHQLFGKPSHMDNESSRL